MKCAFNPTRLVRCLTCEQKCPGFMHWYQNHKQEYIDMVEDYVTRFPEKYEKEFMLMARQSKDLSNTDKTKRMVAIVDADNNLVSIVSKDSLTQNQDMGNASGHRFLELTGKEYELVVSIALKQKPLQETLPSSGVGKKAK